MRKILLPLLLVVCITSTFSQDYRDKYVGVYQCFRHCTIISISDTVFLYFEKNIYEDSLLYLIDSAFALENPGVAYVWDLKVWNSNHFLQCCPLSDYLDGYFFPLNDSVSLIRDEGSTPWGHIFCFYKGIKINTSNINKNHEKDDFMIFFPNPVNDFLTVHFQSPFNLEKVVYELYDFTGKSVLQEEVINDFVIDFSNLTQGMYILKIESGDLTFYRKILKRQP